MEVQTINPHRCQYILSNFQNANQIQLDHTIRYSASQVIEKMVQEKGLLTNLDDTFEGD